jgi:hypothetical protein
MNSPREILLNRHRAAEPGLDTLRRQVLARELPDARAGGISRLPSLVALGWEQLVLPCRGIWAGLGAAWAVILLLTPAADRPILRYSGPAQAAAAPPLELKQQRALRAELLEIAPHRTACFAPIPGPSSQAPAGWNSARQQPDPQAA